MSKLSWKNLDAEATLLAPFILMFSLLPYLLAAYTLFAVFPSNFILNYVLQFALLTTTLSLLLCGIALVYATKPLKVRNALWLPFVYLYWSLQAFIAFYALVLISLRRPKHWTKTQKTGAVSGESLNVLAIIPENQFNTEENECADG